MEIEEYKSGLPVARALILQQMSKVPALVNTYESGIAQVDFYTMVRQQYLYRVACGIMDVSPGRPFRILAANTTNSVINQAKHQRLEVI